MEKSVITTLFGLKLNKRNLKRLKNCVKPIFEPYFIAYLTKVVLLM